MNARIAVFLESGKRTRAEHKTRKTQSAGEIKPNNIIEENFVCSEKHRAFFKEQVGKSFSFNVAFQKWHNKYEDSDLAVLQTTLQNF